MEYWIKRVFLMITVFLCTEVYSEESTPVIEPNIDRREVELVSIDSSNVEIGAYYGLISIEDFDTQEYFGARLSYHVSESFFFQLSYGEAEGDLTTFEELSGSSPLFSEEDRDYLSYDISIGWNVLPGEIFIADQYAFNSAFYFIAGIGSTEFAGDTWFTVNYGAGFKVLLNDWISWHIDVRDHVFDRDTFGVDETVHNIEFTTGLSIYF